MALLPFGASLRTKLYSKLPRLAAEMRRQTETQDEFTLRRVQVIRQLNPLMAPYQVREKAAVARACRNPAILRAMGYHLVGTRWVIGNEVEHPLYGLAVASGP